MQLQSLKTSTIVTMKSLVAITAIVCAFAFLEVSAQEKYPEEFDKLDVDALIKDQEKVAGFAKCLLKDECTELGGKLKAVLLDALNTDCAKCTEIQKGHIRKASNFFINSKPDVWNQVVAKYDPEGKHKEGFKKFLAGGN